MSGISIIRASTVAVLAGCAFAHAQPLETAPHLAPTCAAAVHIFTSAERVPGEYTDLAIVRVSGGDWTASGTMFDAMRRKAAHFGANGLVYRALNMSPSLWQSKSGEAIAIYIPSDIARIARECSPEAIHAAAAEDDSLHARGPNPLTGRPDVVP